MKRGGVVFVSRLQNPTVRVVSNVLSSKERTRFAEARREQLARTRNANKAAFLRYNTRKNNIARSIVKNGISPAALARKLAKTNIALQTRVSSMQSTKQKINQSRKQTVEERSLNIENKLQKKYEQVSLAKTEQRMGLLAYYAELKSITAATSISLRTREMMDAQKNKTFQQAEARIASLDISYLANIVSGIPTAPISSLFPANVNPIQAQRSEIDLQRSNTENFTTVANANRNTASNAIVEGANVSVKLPFLAAEILTIGTKINAITPTIKAPSLDTTAPTVKRDSAAEESGKAIGFNTSIQKLTTTLTTVKGQRDSADMTKGGAYKDSLLYDAFGLRAKENVDTYMGLIKSLQLGRVEPVATVVKDATANRKTLEAETDSVKNQPDKGLQQYMAKVEITGTTVVVRTLAVDPILMPYNDG